MKIGDGQFVSASCDGHGDSRPCYKDALTLFARSGVGYTPTLIVGYGGIRVLTEKDGEVVTKEEIWNRVWPDVFVEETNLTHNIYLLCKTFKQYGKANLIQTVPRRGYRFVDKIDRSGDVVLERLAITRTLIEDVSDTGVAEHPGKRFVNVASGSSYRRHCKLRVRGTRRP